MRQTLDQILIRSSQSNFAALLGSLRKKLAAVARFAGYDSEENKTVVAILRDVAEQGDPRLAAYTERFDGVRLSPEQFRVSAEDLAKAHCQMDDEILLPLRRAIANVREYQQRILTVSKSDISMGAGIRYVPIKRVGVCVPGAAAPLPSTVVMTVVPAQVAGVQEIAVVSPPRCKGSIHPVILAACYELGIDEVYRIGGVQAVAALAFGTQTIRKVDMIVGPGNKWVQAAKKHVAGDHVRIDSVAGPSEVLIIANDQANPSWVAADMLSQAEHGTDSSAVLLTDCEKLASDVLDSLKQQVSELARRDEALQSLVSYSRIVVLESIDKAIEIANDLAGEHVEIQCGRQSRQIAERITNAGAIFIGPYSPVAVGDYWAGPSHTLPTGSRAKFASALTSNDFVKSISIIEFDQKRFSAAADDIIHLAEVEGLDAHAMSIKIRQKK